MSWLLTDFELCGAKAIYWLKQPVCLSSNVAGKKGNSRSAVRSEIVESMWPVRAADEFVSEKPIVRPSPHHVNGC